MKQKLTHEDVSHTLIEKRKYESFSIFGSDVAAHTIAVRYVRSCSLKAESRYTCIKKETRLILSLASDLDEDIKHVNNCRDHTSNVIF